MCSKFLLSEKDDNSSQRDFEIDFLVNESIKFSSLVLIQWFLNLDLSIFK